MAAASNNVPKQVRQVRNVLMRDYAGLLDTSDLTQRAQSDRDNRLLSRALTALAVRIVTGCDQSTAATFVIDGHLDNGVDAIAMTQNPPHVYLVQTKWSDAGTASLDQDAAAKLIDGLGRIDDELSTQFNARGEMLAEQAKTLMSDNMAPVTLVIALMGTSAPNSGPAQILKNAERKFNTHGSRLDTRTLLAPDFYAQVKADLAPEPLSLAVEMHKWLRYDGSRPSYQGTVRVEDVAAWYDQHSSRLFDLNIRNPLGITRTNAGIVTTLVEEPENFWYFNNGITVLCDTLEEKTRSLHAPHSMPVGLLAQNASIVNGAQTVIAISEAMARDPAAAAQAHVSVRVIATGGAGDFAKRATQATNLQNRVEPRDFIALDVIQSEIRSDLAIELDKEYTIKRGPDPAPESGCSITEAATALCCTHPNPEYVTRVTRSTDLLWERGSKGAYDVLFHPQPSARHIWRAVITVRDVREWLHSTKSRRIGRAAAVVQHGEYLIAHLVLQHLGTESIDDPDYDWKVGVLDRVPDATQEMLERLIHHVDSQFGEHAQVAATLNSPDRSKILARTVLADISKGIEMPGLPEEYQGGKRQRGRRRPNTVSFLVDAKAIEEGASLVFYAPVNVERAALAEWLAADPRRKQATWVNDRTKPLLWAADQQVYTPTGLVTRIWELADWQGRPVAVQGPARWQVESGETLWEMALRIQGEEGLGEPE